MISGFVMVLTTQAKHPTPLHFMKNRVARIVPIYWVMTFLVFSISIVAPSLVKATRPDVVELLKSMFFIPFVKGNGLISPVLFVGWTLNYEMFFYLIFAISLFSRNYVGGLLGCIALLVGLATYGALVHPASVFGQVYTRAIILNFGMGMLLALAVKKAPEQASTVVKALVLAGIVVLLPVMFVTIEYFTDEWRVLLSGIPAVAIVGGAVLLDRWNWTVRNATLLLLGDASYVLYLSHPYITQPVQAIVMRMHPGPVLVAALIPATLAAALVAAVILHRWLELPMSRWARRLLAV